MKKWIALLLTAVMCLSLAACSEKSGTGVSIPEEEYAKYLQYEELINMLDIGDYEGALGYINSISGYVEDDRTDDTGSEEATATEPSETEPKEQTIELTVDNWQDFFEIRPNTNGVLRNSFGEFERLDYVHWALFLKADAAQKVTGMEDVAIEYSFRDGYYSWFTYNLDTGEFLLQDAAAEEEISGYTAPDDKNRDLSVSYGSVTDENGQFLVWINRHLLDSLTDNIYSFIGEAWGTMEMVRVKGTITIAE